MRDGSGSRTVDALGTSAGDLASLMVGELAAESPSDVAAVMGLAPVAEAGAPPSRPGSRHAGAPAGWSSTTSSSRTTTAWRRCAGVDLTVAAGRGLGVAGVAGNGQVELAEALAGVRPARSGAWSSTASELVGRHTAAG